VHRSAPRRFQPIPAARLTRWQCIRKVRLDRNLISGLRQGCGICRRSRLTSSCELRRPSRRELCAVGPQGRRSRPSFGVAALRRRRCRFIRRRRDSSRRVLERRCLRDETILVAGGSLPAGQAMLLGEQRLATARNQVEILEGGRRRVAAFHRTSPALAASLVRPWYGTWGSGKLAR
jgi:hypothetical protein